MKYEIDYAGLEVFLRTLTYRSIKEGALTSGWSRGDIERFHKTDKSKSKITLDQVIEYNAPFLVDLIGNDLSVCISTRRKYKNPKGRAVRAKLDRTIIHDCKTTFGSCLNGYWIIPDRFITISKT